jgi:hypothetical protein
MGLSFLMLTLPIMLKPPRRFSLFCTELICTELTAVLFPIRHP